MGLRMAAIHYIWKEISSVRLEKGGEVGWKVHFMK
jgi:hypothetical protein